METSSRVLRLYLAVGLMAVAAALAFFIGGPWINARLERREMLRTVQGARQIHDAIFRMQAQALDAGAPSALPADAGISSVQELRDRLVAGGFLTSRQADDLHFENYQIGNISQADPGRTILLKKRDTQGLVIFRLGGDALVKVKPGLAAQTNDDPPRQPAYLKPLAR